MCVARLVFSSRGSWSLFRRRIVLACGLLLVQAVVASAGPLIISEFRWRGPNGANDEFIEIYNNSTVDHTVAASSGTGYGVAASDGTTRCTIPNGTVIPAKGHYLCVNSVGYSLASYPSGGGATATGNSTYTTDIPDNMGIAVFNNNSGGASYSLANRFDAVGTTSEANAIYKEGAGLPTLVAFSIDYAWVRKLPGGCTGSGGGGNCTSTALMQTTQRPTSTQSQDTNNNASDFIFVDTNGTSAGGGQRLGAPGPENLAAPISREGNALQGSTLDPCINFDAPPNQVRDFTSDPANNSTFGTFDFRRTFTNTTGYSITRLRFRILDVSTFPSISGVADLRPRTSTDVVVTVDRVPCTSGTSNITVRGTTLEQPPSQPNGSGYNGSLSVGAVSGGAPLLPGTSINVRFLLGIQQTGIGRFCVAAETYPVTSAQVFCSQAPADVVKPDFDGNGKTDILWRNTSTGEDYLWLMDGTTRTGGASLTTVADLAWKMVGTGDFSGDGKPDILWRNGSTGENYVWYMDGVTRIGGGFLDSVTDAAWRIVATGDFNGDGKPDVLWRNASTGDNYLWYMDGLTRTSGASVLALADLNWKIVGAGDFNSDGHPDIVWRNTSTGENYVWYMSGTTRTGGTSLPTVADTNWSIAFVGDFSGDGRPDVLWRNYSTGEDGVWTLDGVSYVSYTSVVAVSDLTWGILAGANSSTAAASVPSDFNSDGKPDILWRNVSTGANAIWYMNGSSYSSYASVASIADTNWRSVATADFNSDGKPDIVWRNIATGQNAIWYMNGSAYVSYAPVDTVPVAWRLVAAADFTGDGKPDLVWRNMTTGENGIWTMNGAAYVSYTALPTVADTAWRIEGAADFNADGKSDLVWRNINTGENIIWYMNGTAYSSYVNVLTNADPNWLLVMVADFNSDGRPDFLWRHEETGENAIWFLNGASYVSYAPVMANGDIAWQIGQQ